MIDNIIYLVAPLCADSKSLIYLISRGRQTIEQSVGNEPHWIAGRVLDDAA